MKTTFSKRAAKALEAFDKPTQTRIIAGILAIPKGDIKLLQGYSDGRMRLRIGKYRIVFNYMVENDEEVLYIMDAGSRGDIYK
jgi:mRNA interferase RelE/StbE